MLKLGTQNIPALYLGGEQIKKAYLGDTVVFGARTPSPSRLPEGYTEVEYIESSGTQYISTGVKPVAGITIAIDIEPLDGPESTSSPICYSNYFPSSGTKYILNLAWASNGISISSGSGTSFALSPIVTNNTPRRMGIIVDYPNKKASIVGEGEIGLRGNSVISSMTVISLLSSKPNYAGFISAKLYSCQIEIDGVVTRDFVPCIDPSGAVGLYDLVEGKFYGNAGTGAFTAGPAA